MFIKKNVQINSKRFFISEQNFSFRMSSQGKVIQTMKSKIERKNGNFQMKNENISFVQMKLQNYN